jgi:hypothetical protein
MERVTDIEALLPLLGGAGTAKEVGRRMCEAGLAGMANAALYRLALERLGIAEPTLHSTRRYLSAATHTEEYAEGQRRLGRAKYQSAAHKKRNREYQARRRAEDPGFRLANRVRTLINMSLRKGEGLKTARSEEYLDCSWEQFRRHIEAHFTEGMSWENQGDWHLDHVRPCASFDLADPEQQRACMHWSNWRPMWAEQNVRKSSKWRGRRWRHGEAVRP